MIDSSGAKSNIDEAKSAAVELIYLICEIKQTPIDVLSYVLLSHWQELLAKHSERNSNEFNSSDIEGLRSLLQYLGSNKRFRQIDSDLLSHIDADKAINQLSKHVAGQEDHKAKNHEINLVVEVSLTDDWVKQLNKQSLILVQYGDNKLSVSCPYSAVNLQLALALISVLNCISRGEQLTLVSNNIEPELRQEIMVSNQLMGNWLRLTKYQQKDWYDRVSARINLLKHLITVTNIWLGNKKSHLLGLKQQLDALTKDLNTLKKNYYQSGGERLVLHKELLLNDHTLVASDCPQKPILLSEFMVAEVELNKSTESDNNYIKDSSLAYLSKINKLPEMLNELPAIEQQFNQLINEKYQVEEQTLLVKEEIKTREYEKNSIEKELLKKEKLADSDIEHINKFYKYIAEYYCQRSDSDMVYQLVKSLHGELEDSNGFSLHKNTIALFRALKKENRIVQFYEVEALINNKFSLHTIFSQSTIKEIEQLFKCLRKIEVSKLYHCIKQREVRLIAEVSIISELKDKHILNRYGGYINSLLSTPEINNDKKTIQRLTNYAASRNDVLMLSAMKRDLFDPCQVDLNKIGVLIDQLHQLTIRECEDGVLIKTKSHQIGVSRTTVDIINLLDCIHYLSQGKSVQLAYYELVKETGIQILIDSVTHVLKKSPHRQDRVENVCNLLLNTLAELIGHGELFQLLKRIYQIKKQSIIDSNFVFSVRNTQSETMVSELSTGELVRSLLNLPKDKTPTSVLCNNLLQDIKANTDIIQEILKSESKDELTLSKRKIKSALKGDVVLSLFEGGVSLSHANREVLVNSLLMNMFFLNTDLDPKIRASIFKLIDEKRGCDQKVLKEVVSLMGITISDSLLTQQTVIQAVDAVSQTKKLINDEISQLASKELVAYVSQHQYEIGFLWSSQTLNTSIRKINRELNQIHNPKRLYQVMSDLLHETADDNKLKNLCGSVAIDMLISRVQSESVISSVNRNDINQDSFNHWKKIFSEMNEAIFNCDEKSLKKLTEKENLDSHPEDDQSKCENSEVGRLNKIESLIADRNKKTILFDPTVPLDKSVLNKPYGLVSFFLYVSRQTNVITTLYYTDKDEKLYLVKESSEPNRKHRVVTNSDEKKQITAKAISYIYAFQTIFEDYLAEKGLKTSIKGYVRSVLHSLFEQFEWYASSEFSVSWFQQSISQLLADKLTYYLYNFSLFNSSEAMLEQMNLLAETVLLSHPIECVELTNIHQHKLYSIASYHQSGRMGRKCITHHSGHLTNDGESRAFMSYDLLHFKETVIIKEDGSHEQKFKDWCDLLYGEIAENSRARNCHVITFFDNRSHEQGIEIAGRYTSVLRETNRLLQSYFCDSPYHLYSDIDIEGASQSTSSYLVGLEEQFVKIDDFLHQMFNYDCDAFGKTVKHELFAMRYMVHNCLDSGIIGKDNRIDVQNSHSFTMIDFISTFINLNQKCIVIKNILDRNQVKKCPTVPVYKMIIQVLESDSSHSDIADFLSYFLCKSSLQYYASLETVNRYLDFVKLNQGNLSDLQLEDYLKVFKLPHKVIASSRVKHPGYTLIGKTRYNPVSDQSIDITNPIYLISEKDDNFINDMSLQMKIDLVRVDFKKFFCLSLADQKRIYRFFTHEQIMLDDMRRINVHRDDHQIMPFCTIDRLNGSIANYLYWLNQPIEPCWFYQKVNQSLLKSMITQDTLEVSETHRVSQLITYRACYRLNIEIALTHLQLFKKKESASQSKQVIAQLQEAISNDGFSLSVIWNCIKKIYKPTADMIESDGRTANSLDELISLLLCVSMQTNDIQLSHLEDELLVDKYDSIKSRDKALNDLAMIALKSPEKKLGASLVRTIRKSILYHYQLADFYAHHMDYHVESIHHEKLIAELVSLIALGKVNSRFSLQGRITAELPVSDLPLIERLDLHGYCDSRRLLFTMDVTSHPFLYHAWLAWYNEPVSRALIKREDRHAIFPYEEVLFSRFETSFSLIKHTYCSIANELTVYTEELWDKIYLLGKSNLTQFIQKNVRGYLSKCTDSELQIAQVNDGLLSEFNAANATVFFSILYAMKTVDVEAEAYHYLTAFELIRNHLDPVMLANTVVEKPIYLACNKLTETYSATHQVKLCCDTEKEVYLVNDYFHYMNHHGESFLNNYTFRRRHFVNLSLESQCSKESAKGLIEFLTTNVVSFLHAIPYVFYASFPYEGKGKSLFQSNVTAFEKSLSELYKVNTELVLSGNPVQLVYPYFIFDISESEYNQELASSKRAKETLLLNDIFVVYTLHEYKHFIGDVIDVEKLFYDVHRQLVSFYKRYDSDSTAELHSSKEGLQIQKLLADFKNTNEMINVKTNNAHIQNLYSRMLLKMFLNKKVLTGADICLRQLSVAYLQPLMIFNIKDSVDSFIEYIAKLHILIGYSYRQSSLNQQEYMLFDSMYSVLMNEKDASQSFLMTLNNACEKYHQFDTSMQLSPFYVDALTAMSQKRARTSDELFEKQRAQKWKKESSKVNILTQITVSDIEDLIEPFTLAHERVMVDVLDEADNVSDMFFSQPQYAFCELSLLGSASITIIKNIHLLSLSHRTCDKETLAQFDKLGDCFNEVYELQHTNFNTSILSKVLLSFKSSALEQLLILPALLKFMQKAANKCDEKISIEVIRKNLVNQSQIKAFLLEPLHLSLKVHSLDNDDNEAQEFEVPNAIDVVSVCLDSSTFITRKGGMVTGQFDLGEDHALLETVQQVHADKVIKLNSSHFDFLKSYCQAQTNEVMTDFRQFKHSLIFREKLIYDEEQSNQLVKHFFDESESKEQQSDPFIDSKSAKERAYYLEKQQSSLKKKRVIQAFSDVGGKTVDPFNPDFRFVISEELPSEGLSEFAKKFSPLFFVVNTVDYMSNKASAIICFEYVDSLISVTKNKINELYDVYIPGTPLYEAVYQHEEIVHEIELELQKNERALENNEAVIEKLTKILNKDKDILQVVNVIGSKKLQIGDVIMGTKSDDVLVNLSFVGEVFAELSKIRENHCIEYCWEGRSGHVVAYDECASHKRFICYQGDVASIEDKYEVAFSMMMRLLMNMLQKPQSSTLINIETHDKDMAEAIWGAYYVIASQLSLPSIEFQFNDKSFELKTGFFSTPETAKRLIKHLSKKLVIKSTRPIELLFKVKDKISSSKSLYKIYEALKKDKE